MDVPRKGCRPDPPPPCDLDRSPRFYRERLGLAICREFVPPDDPGLVFFPGQGRLRPPDTMTAVRVLDDLDSGPRRSRRTRPESRLQGSRKQRLCAWPRCASRTRRHRIVPAEVPADHPLRRGSQTTLPAGMAWARRCCSPSCSRDMRPSRVQRGCGRTSRWRAVPVGLAHSLRRPCCPQLPSSRSKCPAPGYRV